jgi:uncharacterized protein
MNRLVNENSAYLKHAAHQKIDWYPWSEEAFARASAEDKPVFLSSGAVWCHWCHVMAAESFEDDEVSQLINEGFVAVKLDRDERPDIDRRYQQAIGAMGFGGGWPLTVFLTPEKSPFYGGTYFPPEDRFGRPGLKNVLRMVSELYRTQRGEIETYSAKILEFFKNRVVVPAGFDEGAVVAAVKAIQAQFDHKHGGFGGAPKFPMSGSIQFLLGRYVLTGDKELEKDLVTTLESMAKGGFHDQLGGGFHRYSTDDQWIVPHFEKMTDDNAWLLRNYAEAYAVLGIERFRTVAEGILSFMRRELSAEEGGFYASQDADVTPYDEGGYFTWTDEDLRAALSTPEYEALSRYLFGEKGAMHHDVSKHVLYVARKAGDIAREMGIAVEEVDRLISSGRSKLLEAREKRQKPFVDTAIYTSLNGMAISAFFRAFRVLGNEEIKNFAVRSLNRVLTTRLSGDGLLHTEGIAGLLDDYIHLIDALLAAYEVSGDSAYLARAEELMTLCVGRFWDPQSGGFFDTDDGLLGIRVKGVEDIPHPSANAVGIMALTKLRVLTGNEEYSLLAGKALKAFSRDAEGMGIHGGTYYWAMDAYFNHLKLDIQAPPDSPLARVAVAFVHPCSTLVYGSDEGRVIPCVGETCYKPLASAADLEKFLQGLFPLSR